MHTGPDTKAYQRDALHENMFPLLGWGMLRSSRQAKPQGKEWRHSSHVFVRSTQAPTGRPCFNINIAPSTSGRATRTGILYSDYSYSHNAKGINYLYFISADLLPLRWQNQQQTAESTPDSKTTTVSSMKGPPAAPRRSRLRDRRTIWTLSMVRKDLKEGTSRYQRADKLNT